MEKTQKIIIYGLITYIVILSFITYTGAAEDFARDLGLRTGYFYGEDFNKTSEGFIFSQVGHEDVERILLYDDIERYQVEAESETFFYYLVAGFFIASIAHKIEMGSFILLVNRHNKKDKNCRLK